METTAKLSPVFVPTKKQSEDMTQVYKYLEQMRQLKEKPMPHFQTGPDGARSFNTYLDDSERILNGYTMSRESQDKDNWQSNLLDNITRAKLRAIAAGVGLKTPEMAFDSVDKNGIRSKARAEIFKNIVQSSYKEDNPTLNSFLEVWHMLAHGVVFEYEGYKTGGAMREVVESFDSETGEVKTKKVYQKASNKPFAILINPQEFFWWTFFVRDIQDQPRIVWVQHYTKTELEVEFSKFPNYKFIKDKTEAKSLSQLFQTSYYKVWSDNVADKDDYEVLRYYSKADNEYEIWVNGIPLLQCPLLWGSQEPKYPFAKQIGEPFANTNFFVGMSLPGILEAYQDGKNSVLNSIIDKLYRSVNPAKLVGLQNRDLLDVEQEIISEDNTIYVPDINAVKFMDMPTINQGELAMLTILDRGIESQSVDRSQQGVTGGVQKTARQAVIEDQRAREIKGILYIFLEDLWRQKTKLRIEVILTHYLKDKAVQTSIKDKIISVKDYTFGDGTRGTLDIYIAKNKGNRLTKQEIEAREMAMAQQGLAYKIISIDVDYLDDWEYDFQIVPNAFHEQDKITKTEELMGEIQQVSTLFPEFFIANKEKYLQKILELHGEHIDEFNPPVELPQQTMGQEQGVPQQGENQQSPTQKPATQPATTQPMTPPTGTQPTMPIKTGMPIPQRNMSMMPSKALPQRVVIRTDKDEIKGMVEKEVDKAVEEITNEISKKIKEENKMQKKEIEKIKKEITPKKGVDYFDGKEGKDGKDGKKIDEDVVVSKVLKKVEIPKEFDYSTIKNLGGRIHIGKYPPEDKTMLWVQII